MIIHCYPKYFKNSTYFCLFDLKLLCKLTHYLSTYFSNIDILPEILQKMLISYIFCKDVCFFCFFFFYVLPKYKLPFPQLLPVFGISRFLRIYLPVEETSLWRVTFSSVCYVMIVRFHSQHLLFFFLIALWLLFLWISHSNLFMLHNFP